MVDCDVLQADGGTRCASITGAFVALHEALNWMAAREMFGDKQVSDVLRDSVAAVSCGIYKGEAVLDLDYPEDSNAEARYQLRDDRKGWYCRNSGHSRSRTV